MDDAQCVRADTGSHSHPQVQCVVDGMEGWPWIVIYGEERCQIRLRINRMDSTNLELLIPDPEPSRLHLNMPPPMPLLPLLCFFRRCQSYGRDVRGFLRARSTGS